MFLISVLLNVLRVSISLRGDADKSYFRTRHYGKYLDDNGGREVKALK